MGLPKFDRRASGMDLATHRTKRQKSYAYLNMTGAGRKMVELRWRKQTCLSPFAQEKAIRDWKAGHYELTVEV